MHNIFKVAWSDLLYVVNRLFFFVPLGFFQALTFISWLYVWNHSNCKFVVFSVSMKSWTHSCCLCPDLFVLRIFPLTNRLSFCCFNHAMYAFTMLSPILWRQQAVWCFQVSEMLGIRISCLVPWMSSVFNFQVTFSLILADPLNPYLFTLHFWNVPTKYCYLLALGYDSCSQYFLLFVFWSMNYMILYS